MGCASLKTQTPPYPLLLSVKWPDMFGEWDTGVWAGLCVWPEVCVCFLSIMAPNSLLQLDRSSLVLNGPGWRPPLLFFYSSSLTVGLSIG